MLDIKVTKVRWDEADEYEGSIPMQAHEDAEETLHENLEIHEAIDLIRGLGLTFAATGNEWAADPDGSRSVSLTNRMREEVTAHPVIETGHDWEWAAVMAGVDTQCQRCLPGNHH